MSAPTELEAWLAAQVPDALAEVVRHLARGCAEVARQAARGALPPLAAADDDPQRLGSRAERCFADVLSACEHVAAWASEEQGTVVVSDEHGSGGAYLVAFDALEGQCHAEAGLSVGSIFSVLPHLFRGTPASDAAFMQPGRRQVAAGYALYGPQTVLVLSLGQGVQMFTLDPDDRSPNGRWWLARDAVQVPVMTTEYAINASNQRYWEKPVQRYVAECTAGANGPRGRDFNMRWTGSLVADVHRILLRGGVYLQPRDSREPYRPGRLRLLYEAAPLAWLMQQAGAGASTGTAALLDLVPDALQQRVPAILGSRSEVERLVGYHADPSENVSWQLFKTRSLFIQPNA